jgi:hypothetical protein
VVAGLKSFDTGFVSTKKWYSKKWNADDTDASNADETDFYRIKKKIRKFLRLKICVIRVLK